MRGSYFQVLLLLRLPLLLVLRGVVADVAGAFVASVASGVV